MILEVAILNVIPGLEDEFEAAFKQASPIISTMQGYGSHQIRRCLEQHNRYILLVEWATLEDHTFGFRGSPNISNGNSSSIIFMLPLQWSSTTKIPFSLHACWPNCFSTDIEILCL
jgi:heme-degrading monooxygenase HmoA